MALTSIRREREILRKGRLSAEVFTVWVVTRGDSRGCNDDSRGAGKRGIEVRTQPGEQTQSHLVFMERILRSACHLQTQDDPCKMIRTNVNESIFKAAFLPEYKNIQDCIDSPSQHYLAERTPSIRIGWFYQDECCQKSLPKITKGYKTVYDTNVRTYAAKNDYNSHVTHLPDMFFIEDSYVGQETHRQHLRNKPHFIQQEISLRHVQQDGTYFESAERLKTHRLLHSIVYGDGGHFISRFSYKDCFYEYDGMNRSMNDIVGNDRVKCEVLVDASNPFPYFVRNYYACFIIYVKIENLSL